MPKVNNQKESVPTGMKLNDKDYITDILSCLKSMAKNYTIAMTEASNECLYCNLKDRFNKIIELQREVYELMFYKGWYQMESAPNTKVNTKYQTLLKEYEDLNN